MASSSILCATPLSASAALTANASRAQSGAAAGPSAVAALPLGRSRSTQKWGAAAGLRSSSFVANNVGARFEAVSRGLVARCAAGSAVTICKVSIGDEAPSFSLADQNGRTVSLSKFKGKPVVLYFYPKDDTPGCTKQACSFRDSYADFKKAGAEVVGISADSPESHKAFAEKYDLPFTLLSDEDNSVRQAFGIKGDFFGALPGRETYVLDKKGVVQLVFNNQFSPEKHVAETIKVIEEIKADQKGGLFANLFQ
ncbi:peroxiredoxin [Klebsormidium nitens]|uniref:thioredoxin-dependent peroxiredoxin n=1 Tax=Klebsormidium nitens TaxID=105231 RepID=A0A1Y1HPH0_KLENI|nr:peroxiredoxin [Klebsormidium nitens]|eukprot:GAQ78506.1 peroxiredoxin [Klebsormidium nitens]